MSGTQHHLKRATRVPVAGLLLLLMLFALPAHAATHLVRIGDYFFTPTNLTIAAGDTVLWSNAVTRPHDTTHRPASGPPLWASPTFSRPGTFSFTFTNAGFYPYVCLLHVAVRPQQTGTVTVLAPNQLPVVTITSPTNNQSFVEPGAFAITADASDPDGTVTNVLFLLDGASVGESAGPIFSTTVTGLVAGSYAVRAVAQDNSAASVTSAPVNVVVQAPPRFPVNLVSAPAAGGGVDLNPPSPPGGYLAGTMVTLTPMPAPGYFFTNWSGTISNAENPLVLTVEEAVNLTAHFQLVPRTLTLAVEPPLAGLIQVSPTPNGPGGTYLHGTPVTLTAVPAPGFAFANWSGDAGGTNPVAVVPMTANASATAHFVALPVRFLTLSNEPANGGSVAVSPLPNAPGGGYYEGTRLTLTASAAEKFSFTNWSGAVSNADNPLLLTLDADKTVVAHFVAEAAPPRTLTLTADPPDGAALLHVSPSPNGPGGTYVDGTLVRVEAVAASGYTFTNWTGAVNSDSNVVHVLMDADRALTAHFTLVPRYTLVIKVSPTNGGTVLALPKPNAPNGQYLEGTVVILVPEPAADFVFQSWSGAFAETALPERISSPAILVVRSNTTVTAHFARLYSLTTVVSPPNIIFVSADPFPNDETGGRFVEGTVVTLQAFSFTGDDFIGWSGDVSGTASVIAVTMDTNKLAVANFFRPPVAYTLVLTTNPAGAGSVVASPGPRPDGTYGGGVTMELRATPAAGFRFVRWSGDVPLPGTANPLSFTTDPNPPIPRQTLSIGAVFEPRPIVDFTNAAATYAGLVMNEAPDFNSSGHLSLRVKSSGAFKGTVRLGGGRSAISGRFDQYGDATFTLRRRTLQGTLQLDARSGGISGVITDGRQSPSLQLWRGLGRQPASRPASYSLTLEPVAPVLTPGSATVTIAGDGSVKVRGVLGDGTKWSCDSFVTVRDSIEVYAPLYHRRGAILGALDGRAAPGLLHWFRPADSRSRSYPSGFALEVPLTSVAP